MINNQLIKVCGMTEGENIRAIEALGVDLIGFIFYPGSPRFVRETPSYLPAKAGRVGVFVDAPREEILRRNETYRFDYVQLHGSESPEFCAQLRERDGLRVIKAFGIAEESVRNTVAGYEGACDLFLFDTKTPGHGGSGSAGASGWTPWPRSTTSSTRTSRASTSTAASRRPRASRTRN